MKKLLLAFCAVLLLAYPAIADDGCGCPDPNAITKTMETPFEGLELSSYAGIEGELGYIKLYMGLGASDAANMWQDLEIFKSRNINKIKLYINSPGGSATDGMAIANILEGFRKQGGYIEAIAYGEVASATVPIFAVANKRIAQKDVVFMVHNSKIGKYGYFFEELKDLDAQRSMIKLITSNYMNKLSMYTKLSSEEWEQKAEKITYFDTKQAKEWGLVDEIK